MKFRNKQTNEVIEVKGYVQEFAYSHNSAWEKVGEAKETTGTKEPTIAEIKAKLDELGIEYDKKATKADLLTLLPQKVG